MHSRISGTDSNSRGRRTPLTSRRKNMIKIFQKFNFVQPGSKYWRDKLYEHMHSLDKQVNISDVDRWVEKYHWITDDCVSTRRNDDDQNSQSQQPFIFQRQPQERQPVSAVTIQSNDDDQNSQSQQPFVFQRQPQERQPVSAVTIQSNDDDQNSQSQQPFVFQRQPQERQPVSAVTMQSVNTFDQRAPSHIPTYNNESSRQRPDLPLTPASTLSSVSQTNTPMQSPSSHPESGPSIQVHIESPTSSNVPGFQAEPMGPLMNEEQLKKEYYSSAFNAISVLHEICSQMPEVRVCLRPLKDIHKCFVRTHEKFIFPEEYSAVRGHEQPMRAQMSNIKVDPAYIDPDECTLIQDQTVEI